MDCRVSLGGIRQRFKEEVWTIPHLHLKGNQDIQKPEPVVHLQRPRGFLVHLTVGANQLIRDPAFYPQELKPFALEKE
jgi:hypothetical protein